MTTDTEDSGVVWDETLDDEYHCRVVRLEPYKGLLEIFDVDDNLVHTEMVGISFDALYGPDADDVRQWQETCDRWVSTGPW